MKVSDAVTGAMFVAIAIFVFVHAGGFPAMRGVAYGPDLFPRIVAAMMALGGTILIVGALRPAGRQPLLMLADWARQPRSYVLMAAVVGSMLFYILFSARLGYLLTSFLSVGAIFVATRGLARLPSSVLIAVSVSAATYLIFARTLRVPLPYGFVEALLAG